MVFVEFQPYWFLVLLVISVILNLIPDYLSLLESRYIISLLRNSTSVPKHMALIVLDFIATFLIALIALSVFLIIAPAVFDVTSDMNTFLRALSFTVLSALPFSSINKGGLSFGIWFYSTFFTSVWVWIHILSGILLSTRKPINLFITKFKRFFDVEKKPFLSMGGVSVIVITAMYPIIIPVVFILKDG